MKSYLKIVLVAVFALALAACSSEPTLDASSEEAMEKSVEIMTVDMTEAEKMAFGMAIASIAMEVGFANMGDEEKMEAAIKEKLDGKTVQEILDMQK